MTRATTRLMLAATLVFGAVSAAQADSVAFRYKDLDLTTDAGKAELERRIEEVTRRACPDEAVTGSRIAVAGAREQCAADVRRQVMARINVPTGGGSSSR